MNFVEEFMFLNSYYWIDLIYKFNQLIRTDLSWSNVRIAFLVDTLPVEFENQDQVIKLI